MAIKITKGNKSNLFAILIKGLKGKLFADKSVTEEERMYEINF